MSRLKLLVRGLASGYVQMGANIVYSIGTVPIALHYLTKEEFGLWALVTQVASYFALIDMGMQGSVARILIDHKDDRDGGDYGAVIKTASIVFVVQGLIVALVGCLLSPLASSLLGLQASNETQFMILVGAQCILLGLGFFVRVFGATLYAHQRYDILNVTQAVQLLVMLVTLWMGFRFGWGLYSMIFSGAVALVWNSVVQVIAGLWLGLFPARRCWGKAKLDVFWSLFAYGKDLFLMALGWQLLSASQVIIVTRTMGLDAAATWSICSKMFTLGQQVVWRIFDFSVGAFSEMYVRGEQPLLKKRFKDTLKITASVSVLGAALGAVCNSDFVSIWTGGKIGWAPINDVLMAVLLISYSVNRCHGGFVLVSKEIGFAKYIYFADGLCFVALAFPAAKYAGFPGIIAVAIVCDIAFAGNFGLHRSRRFFNASIFEMVFLWLKNAIRYTLVLSLVACGIWFATRFLQLPERLIVSSITLTMVGLLLLWVIGMDKSMRDEIGGIIRNFAKRKSRTVV